MKVDCVLILGPSGEFHPLVTEDYPKFTLPFLNIPLVNLTINYLTPFASKFYVVCLEKHSRKVKALIDSPVPFEILTTTSYEGMAYILNMLKNKIKTAYFIMCKGDIYGVEPLGPLLESFVESGDDIYLPISKNIDGYSPIMMTDSNKRLRMFNEETIPLIRDEKCTLTCQYEIKDLFMIKTRSLVDLENSLYGFKNNILPFLIHRGLKIKVYENIVHQVKTMNDYLAQLEFKNNIFGSLNETSYNLIDQACCVENGVEIEDSVIGTRTVIGHNSIVKRSIIMDNVMIEDNCLVDSCVIGAGSLVFSKSELKDCKVANNHIFKHSIKASHNLFTKE